MAKQVIKASKSELLAALEKCPQAMLVNGQALSVKAKQFSTGSLGLNLTGKITLDVPGVGLVQFQFSGNAVAIGSADCAQGE